MFPLQFILLLLVASAPMQMALLAGGVPSPAMHVPAWPLFASFFATQLLLVLLVWSRTRGAIRALHSTPAGAARITHRIEQFFGFARWCAIVLVAVHLFCTPLANYVLVWVEHTQVIKYIPAFAETLFISPAVIAWMGIWTASYHVETANHDRTLPFRLAQGDPVHPMPSLGQFLGMQARHNFFPYIMVLVVGIFDSAGRYLQQWHPTAPDIASLVATAVIFVMLPFVLVRIWRTAPLAGPLRERLDRVAQRHRLRFRNILLWRTHNLIPNAAILGWLPFGRYFLMSDSLVESFSDKQLEAVFAHEVGHGVHRHIPWFLAIFAAAAAFSLGVGGLATHLAFPGMSGETVAMTLSSLVLFLIGGGAFYFIAPRFEHQADWFAARHMSQMAEEEAPQNVTQGVITPVTPMPEELNWTLSTAPTAAETLSLQQYVAGEYPHAPGVQPVIQRSEEPRTAVVASGMAGPKSAMGAEIFISALDSLVETLNRDRTRRDIMHPSINDRVALLRALTADPAEEEKFNRSMRKTRLVIVGLLAAGIATAAIAAIVGEKAPQRPATHPATAASPTAPATRPATTSASAPAANQ